jgi:hypothetical protein
MLSLKLRVNCRASSHARSRHRAGTTSRESHQTIHWIFRRLHRPSETRDSEPIMTAARDRLGRGCRESRGDRSESSVPRPARRSQRSARWAPQTVVTATVVAFAAFAFAFVAANGVTWVRHLNSSQTERLAAKPTQLGARVLHFDRPTLDWTTGTIRVRMILTLLKCFEFSSSTCTAAR